MFAIKSLDDASGGAERVCVDVSNGLAARGHKVLLLSYDVPGGQSYYELDRSVRRIALGLGRTDRRATLIETLRRLPALRRVVRRERPDVVVGFMHSMFIPLGLALLGMSVPQVASEHIVYTHYDDRPLERLLLRITPYLVRRITVLSECVSLSYPPAIQRHMMVMPNPVARAKTRADVTGKNQSRKIVLTVGRLSPQKDHRTFIEAFSRVASDFPNWDARIVGEGELLTDLELLIDNLGMKDRISVPGPIREISEEYKAAQIFAISSRYESFGLSTAEALAHGLPAVGFSDCPGTNELILDGKNGILVNGENRADAFAEGLRRLMSSVEERSRLGGNGPASVYNFSPESVYDRWEKLLVDSIQL